MTYMHENAEPFLWEGTNGEGVLLVHSFTGTPAQMRPIGETLHAQGFTTHAVLLAGHGTALEDMARTGAASWLASVREGARNLADCTRLHLVGFAMGGLLCLQVAKELGASTVVTINAPLRFRSWKTYLAPIVRFAQPYRYWPEVEPAAEDRYADYRIQYRGYPMAALAQFVGLSISTRRYLAEVTCPTLIVQARGDEDTDPRSAEMIAGRLGAERKELFWLEGAEHEALLGDQSDLIERRVVSFMTQA